MNVVLYLRYSSDKQNEQSIEGQQRICTEYCKQNGMNVVDIYTDRALSASKNTEKRIAFLKMIADSEKQKFQAVIVYKLDRFARNRYDSALYKNKLSKNGVKVISATESISETPEGVILESLLEGMAEFYSKELSQKVTRGMRETALKCNSCGGSIPLGYKIVDKKYVIDEKTAPIVIEAFTRYAEGEKISEICQSFNERGYRTSKGSKFNKHSFANIFRNEKYIGIYHYNDISIPNGLPQIIEKETFDIVQAKIQKNTQAPARSKAKTQYLLSGKLFCGHCTSLMNGEYGTSKTGIKYHYYVCSTKKKNHCCDKKNVSKNLIEEAVVEKAISLLTPEGIDEIANMAVEASQKEVDQDEIIPALRAELEKVEKAISNLLKLVERGSSSETLFNRLEELEEQKKQLIKSINNSMRDVVILEKEHVIWWLQKFAQGDINDPDYKRLVIDMLVNSVTIWDEPDGYRITILYNVTSKKTETFKCSDLSGNGSPKNGRLHTRLAVFYLFTIISSLFSHLHICFFSTLPDT